jgi:FtsZ-binding cell division protein ZapB
MEMSVFNEMEQAQRLCIRKINLLFMTKRRESAERRTTIQKKEGEGNGAQDELEQVTERRKERKGRKQI